MAIALFTRLPRVLAPAKTGLFDYRMLATIVSRTELIQDPDVLERVDHRLAERALKWVRLSEPKIQARVNAVIAAQNPEAVRIREQIRRDREVGGRPNGDGTAEIWGRIDLAALAAMNVVLDAMAGGVCPGDPRTKEQRRSNAFFAVFRRQAMSCRCEQPDCAAEPVAPPGAGVVPRAKLIVHVIADAARSAGMVSGYGQIDADALDEAGQHATHRDVDPAEVTEEQRRFPSGKLADYIRVRDLTCRFPGCNVPAGNTDIDQTVPYPAGPTHPSNPKCLCRAHVRLAQKHSDDFIDSASGQCV